MISLTEEIEKDLIELGDDHGVYLEGSILKMLDQSREPFVEYIKKATKKDKETRRKRLEITKQFQDQNTQLLGQQEENERLMKDLQTALHQAENAKEDALKDLSVMQQKTQVELIGNIVQIALWVIVGVGIIVTGMYLFSMWTESTETTLIGNTWSNLFGILLTNSFSIIGTIMGVKYAQENSKEDK
jgi:hypothetical protein